MIRDDQVPNPGNPRGLSDSAIRILIDENKCPMCLGDLDTGWECNSCGYDAMPIGKEIGVIRT